MHVINHSQNMVISAGSIFLLTAIVLYIALEARGLLLALQPGSPVPPLIAIVLGAGLQLLEAIIWGELNAM